MGCLHARMGGALLGDRRVSTATSSSPTLRVLWREGSDVITFLIGGQALLAFYPQTASRLVFPKYPRKHEIIKN